MVSPYLLVGHCSESVTIATTSNSRAATCSEICATQGLRCDDSKFHVVNSCAVMKEAIGCQQCHNITFQTVPGAYY